MVAFFRELRVRTGWAIVRVAAFSWASHHPAPEVGGLCRVKGGAIGMNPAFPVGQVREVVDVTWTLKTEEV